MDLQKLESWKKNLENQMGETSTRISRIKEQISMGYEQESQLEKQFLKMEGALEVLTSLVEQAQTQNNEQKRAKMGEQAPQKS